MTKWPFGHLPQSSGKCHRVTICAVDNGRRTGWVSRSAPSFLGQKEIREHVQKTQPSPRARAKTKPNADKLIWNLLAASSRREGEIDDGLAEAWMNAHPAYRQTVQAWLDGAEDIGLPQTSPGDGATNSTPSPSRLMSQSGTERQRRYRDRREMRSLDLPESTYTELKRLCEARELSLDGGIRWLLSLPRGALKTG